MLNPAFVMDSTSSSLDDIVPQIFSLPPEVMLLVFSFCSAFDLVSSCQFVCTLWQDIVLSERAWKGRTLVFKGQKLGRNLANLLQHLPFLSAVCFKNCSASLDLLTVLSTYCHDISSLETHVISTIDLIGLMNFNALAHVDLCVKWNENQHQILFQLPAVPSIETVILRKFCFKDNLAVYLIENCPQLRHLILTKLEKVEEYITLKKMGNLCNTTDSQTANHALHTVYVFSEQHLSREILAVISKLKLETLHHVVLKPTNYSIDEWNTFLFHSPMDNLVTLDLGYATGVSNCLLQTISLNCPNLRTLILTRCDIDDEGIKFVTNSLIKIKILNLHGTLVSLTSLQQFPLQLPNLTDLSLLSCRKISHNFLSDLVCKMPDLLIVLPRCGLLTGSHAISRASPFLPFRNEIK